MAKIFVTLYDLECSIFRFINRYFDLKTLNLFFRLITHIGGARIMLTAVLLISICSPFPYKYIGLASGVSLLVSHLPVALIKKFYPRTRPYIALTESKVTVNPLIDHSFPSGHSTAIFSTVVPIVCAIPMLGLLLLPLACCVGLSRIYLGLHYPSDVLAGSLLGSFTGILSYTYINQLFIQTAFL
ncbi:phosphatase PAP2 family protein [Bacillus sp. AK128]